jgi:nicotinamide-nucleotide amidase
MTAIDRETMMTEPELSPAEPGLWTGWPDLAVLAQRVAGALRQRGQTVAVAEGSCGGLVSASLLAVPGASTYYAGGAVIYTMAANRAFLEGAVPVPPGLRGATEAFALHLARSVSVRLAATWGVGEGGAAGPTGNRYGDPAGHAWVAVAGLSESTSHVLTGSVDRGANMVAFAAAALTLLAGRVEAWESPPAG